MIGVLHEGRVIAAPPGADRHVNTLLMSADDPDADDVMPAEALWTYVERGAFATV